jgi:hypothetical protein
MKYGTPVEDDIRTSDRDCISYNIKRNLNLLYTDRYTCREVLTHDIKTATYAYLHRPPEYKKRLEIFFGGIDGSPKIYDTVHKKLLRPVFGDHVKKVTIGQILSEDLLGILYEVALEKDFKGFSFNRLYHWSLPSAIILMTLLYIQNNDELTNKKLIDRIIKRTLNCLEEEGTDRTEGIATAFYLYCLNKYVTQPTTEGIPEFATRFLLNPSTVKINDLTNTSYNGPGSIILKYLDRFSKSKDTRLFKLFTVFCKEYEKIFNDLPVQYLWVELHNKLLEEILSETCNVRKEVYRSDYSDYGISYSW